MPFRALALFAHPDDETFGPGGTIAELTATGVEVHLVCATRGEAGTIGESPLLGSRRLADVRVEELREAGRILGLRSIRQMHLPDSGLRRLAPETLVRPFVEAVRRLRPHVILTFDAGGVSGHADHRTVTARAIAAFELAADDARWPDLGSAHAASRVWGYTVPESKAARITYRRIHSTPDAEIDACIPVQHRLEQRMAAVAAHATQRPFVDHLDAFLGGIAGYWSEEAFVLEAARVPLPAGMPRPVSDLFAGLDPGE